MANLLGAMKKNAVVLQKPSATIAVRVDLNAVQRKFYDALLYMAKQDLRQDQNKKTFTFPLAWIKEVLNKQEREKIDRNNSYYIEKLKELKHKEAELNILGKDYKEWGSVSLVSALYVREEKGVVTIRFEIPEDIKNSLLDPNGIYANINLIVIRGLKSKYAIILYELVKDYEKVEIPEMTIEKFKELFGIKDKYSGRMDHLRRYVLKPAVEEINSNPHIDFLVNYKLKKTGPRYSHIKFIVKPKPAQIKNEQKADHMAIEYAQEVAKENPELKELLALIPKDLRKRRKIVGIVMSSLDKKGFEYTKTQIEYVLERYENKKIRNFEGYLKQAIEKDYAGAETIELGELEILAYKDLVGVRFTSKTGKEYEMISIEEDTTTRIRYGDEDDKKYYIVYFKNVEDENDRLVLKWSEDEVEEKLERLREIKRKKAKQNAPES